MFQLVLGELCWHLQELFCNIPGSFGGSAEESRGCTPVHLEAGRDNDLDWFIVAGWEDIAEDPSILLTDDKSPEPILDVPLGKKDGVICG